MKKGTKKHYKEVLAMVKKLREKVDEVPEDNAVYYILACTPVKSGSKDAEAVCLTSGYPDQIGQVLAQSLIRNPKVLEATAHYIGEYHKNKFNPTGEKL